uniref:non-specific serine/threonine protein kinase n=1 Tax=Steinernema glaseri TaxID=37863 RepID=A0A1I7XWZ6_9BILA
MAKGSKYGRKEAEEAWQNAEVAALFRLASAGVRVPKPFDFLDGVLLMELVSDAHGDAAPRLNDVHLEADQAREYHDFVIRQIVLMLCTGLVHGDLSEFNVLLGPDGPVLEDRAVGAIVPLAVGDQLAQRIAQAHQLVDAPVQVSDMLVGQGFHVGAGALAVLPQGQQFGHFLQ